MNQSELLKALTPLTYNNLDTRMQALGFEVVEKQSEINEWFYIASDKKLVLQYKSVMFTPTYNEKKAEHSFFLKCLVGKGVAFGIDIADQIYTLNSSGEWVLLNKQTRSKPMARKVAA
jgi:hypothetical protein